jgi:hypothetical protein
MEIKIVTDHVKIGARLIDIVKRARVFGRHEPVTEENGCSVVYDGVDQRRPVPLTFTSTFPSLVAGRQAVRAPSRDRL